MSVKSTGFLRLMRKDLSEFFSSAPHIILGTGTSCAVDVGFGMGALQNALQKGISERELKKSSVTQWRKVLSELKKGTDLENSLNAAESEELQKRILQITCDSVANLDQRYATDICLGRKSWPAMAIVKKVFNGLSSTDKYTLEVITTNYDLLFEYACAANKIPCVDGYCGGVVRHRDWNATLQSLRHRIQKVVRKKNVDEFVLREHIQLYKVHGSLNWFMVGGDVVENDMWIDKSDVGVDRVMITPGLAKYKKMQDFRKELQSDTDMAVNRARKFLFLGYGMNDAHVERYIVKRIKDESLPALIVTREWNRRIDDLARKNSCVTVVCGMANPADGTRVFSPRYKDWQEIPGKCLWDFSEFAKQMM